MGKATILGSKDLNLAPGQYRVRIEKSDSRVAATNEQIDQELTILDNIIPERYSSYSDAIRAHKTAESDLDAIVRQSIESPDADHSAKINSATTAERTAYTNLIKAKSQYQAVVLKQQALQNKRSYLNNQITEDIRTVWCADCQKSLSGEVATMEIPGTDQIIMIRPGGADGSGSEYSVSRDGQLRSVASMSSAEVVWNYTMLPGWQKWKPIYRLGKITNRPPGASKCSVLLDQYSTVQGLATDVERQLHNVPMIYKNRDDGGPYVVGDRVVIEFYNQNHESPRVIGYEEYPCTTTTLTTTTTTLTVTTTTTTSLEIMYTQDYTGAILTYDADAGSFIGPMGNTPYCPGYPPCTFRGLATTGTKLIQCALFHRKLLVLNISTGAVEDIYTDAYAAVFGSPPPAYPTGAWKGILDIGYDPSSGDLVTVMGDPPYDIQGYLVIHDGTSDTISTSGHVFTTTGYQVSPHSVTVVDGDIIVYATRTIDPGSGSYLITMNGMSLTPKSTISWPIAYRYNHITSHNGNLIGTAILADPKHIVLHSGLTPTVLGSFYLSYDPVGIAVYDP